MNPHLKKITQYTENTLYTLFYTFQKLFPKKKKERLPILLVKTNVKTTFADYNSNKQKIPTNVCKSNFGQKPDNSEITIKSYFLLSLYNTIQTRIQDMDHMAYKSESILALLNNINHYV